MGPPPKGLNCEHGDPRKCTMSRFRRQTENIKKVKFLDFDLVIPSNVKVGDFPVPDFCCENTEKFCGMANDFDYIRPLISNINETINFENKTLNASNGYDSNVDFEPEIVRENIFVRGCDPGLSDVISALGAKAIFTFFTSISVITFFLSFLFAILSCFCEPKLEKPIFVNYGRQKVPVSRRL